MLRDDILLAETYNRIIGQSQAKDQAGIGTIVQGNPFNTKLTIGNENEESMEGEEVQDYNKWKNIITKKFPQSQVKWEGNFCRALIDGKSIGFFDRNTNTGMVARS
jgi:hypothetical protein